MLRFLAALKGLLEVLKLARELGRPGERQKVLAPPATMHTASTECHVSRSAAYLAEGLKQLRRDILKREDWFLLARIVGCATGSELERCESGAEELPLAYREALEKNLFVSRDFLEKGDSHVFQSFRLVYCREDCGRLLDQGFVPYVLCSPRGDGLCRVVFYKRREGWSQVIASDSHGNFKSSGGGKSNVCNLIDEMVSRGMWRSQAHVLSVAVADWEALETGRFYRDYVSGMPDTACQDVWDDWYAESERSARRFRSLQESPRETKGEA